MTGHGCNSHQLHPVQPIAYNQRNSLSLVASYLLRIISFKSTPIRRRKFRRPRPKIEVIPRLRINEQIRIPVVRLIDAAGENRGEISTEEALALAKQEELDLVEVSPQAKPPVCRILDYGKFQYQQTKQVQQAKAKQKKVETKGIRIGLRTDTHDLEFKKSQAEKFLSKGNKVKIEILLRGREKALPQKAVEALKNFLKTIAIPHTMEEDIKRFPAGFHVIITPQ